MKTGIRISDNRYTRFIQVPENDEFCQRDTVWMTLRIDYLQRGGGNSIVNWDDLSAIVVSDETGGFMIDHLLDDQCMVQRAPFTAADAPKLLMGQDEYADWRLYGFEIAAHSLKLYYCNLHDTDLRGVIELGQNFRAMQITLDVMESRYSLYIGRHPVQTWALLKRWRRQYMDCQAILTQRETDSTSSRGILRTHEFNGTDSLYVDELS